MSYNKKPNNKKEHDEDVLEDPLEEEEYDDGLEDYNSKFYAK